jgi:hypothetical protein
MIVAKPGPGAGALRLADARGCVSGEKPLPRLYPIVGATTDKIKPS